MNWHGWTHCKSSGLLYSVVMMAMAFVLPVTQTASILQDPSCSTHPAGSTAMMSPPGFCSLGALQEVSMGLETLRGCSHALKASLVLHELLAGTATLGWPKESCWQTPITRKMGFVMSDVLADLHGEKPSHLSVIPTISRAMF